MTSPSPTLSMDARARDVRVPETIRKGPMDEADREGAFERLARQVGPRALSLAQSLLGSRVAAEDAVQEAFERAYRGLAGFRGEASLETWFLRIVINTARRHGRRRAQDRVVAEPERLASEQADSSTSPEGRTAAAELGRTLRQAIDRLAPRQRTAFVLRYVEGLSTAETAALMACAEGTVKAALHRAVAHLREALEEAS